MEAIKSIFARPLFVNPQAYNVIPELYNYNMIPVDLANPVTIRMNTSGIVEAKVLQAGEEIILHLDLYTIDGSCVLGEWYLTGVSSDNIDNVIIWISNNSMIITIENDYTLNNALLLHDNTVLLTSDNTPIIL